MKKFNNLKDKKEKKLNIDYMKIEKIIEDFLDKYEIDFLIEGYIFEDMSQKLNKNEIMNNLEVLLGNKKQSEYVHQLKYEDFIDYKNFIKKLIDEKSEIELNETKDEEERALKKEIFDNMFEEIELTMFDNGISRLTIVTFHYYIKVLENFAQMYLDEAGVTNIKRAKNPLELFLKDLYIILSKDQELTRFLLTLKSLIEQWLTKYNLKTKIGEFYYDILMITPDHIVERILKYLMFTAIKNKNPLTLRAIFSSYLTLIHKNLFSFYATNLSKVKIGYFKQLESLFTENFNLIFDNTHNFQSKQFIVESMTLAYIMKNKRFLKKDYYLFGDEFIQSFFEPNYIDLIRSFHKEDIVFLDHSYFYNKILKFTNNSISRISYFHKINSEFFKNSNKKKYFTFIKERLIEELFDYFYKMIGDKDTINEIINIMAKDISIKLNPNYYLDKDFKRATIEDPQHLKELHNFIGIFARKVLEGEVGTRTYP